MKCDRFGEWLDGGRPREAASEALGHAESCPACAEELEAARALDEVLAQRFATAPASFTDRVIERLPSCEQEDPILVLADGEPVLPWWATALREPSVLGSLILGSILVVWGPALHTIGVEFLISAASLFGTLPTPEAVLRPESPPAAAPLLFGLGLPAAAAALYLLYRTGLTLGGLLFSDPSS